MKAVFKNTLFYLGVCLMLIFCGSTVRHASAQIASSPSVRVPSILSVATNEVCEPALSRLMRLQPLEKASGPLTMEKSSIGDFIGKMNSEARKQDVKTEGIVFLADGIDSTMEIEHEWPVRGKLNDFLFGVAKHNKFYVYSAEQTVLLCSEQRFLELDALAGARQFRAKVMAGGQWQWPTKEMKTAIKSFLPLIQQWSDIAWDSNKEFVFESKPFSCMVVREQPQEILLIEKRVEKVGKVLRHYLIPLKQANLIAEGFFDDNMTFIQFADEALNPSPFAK